MNPKEIEQALMSQQNAQKTPAEKKKEQEAMEKRKVYLQSFMTKDAIERCNKDLYNYINFLL
jgi:hypothetical protein